MALFVDEDAVREAYAEVRNDSTTTNWLVLTYDGKKVFVESTGIDFAGFRSKCTADIRLYGYVRFLPTTDGNTTRAKYAFITWIGPSVSPLKKAKVSTDKAFVKEIFTEFGKEILADELSEINENKIRQILEAASGAAYGTGK